MTAGPDLSREQKAAVASDAPLLVVAAGAGTGKTTTLTSRAARLRDAVQAEGNSVLAVTFTVAAAREMRHRLGLTGHAQATGLDVRTLHALAYRICSEFGLMNRGPGWLLAEAEALEWLRELLAETNSIELPPGHQHPGEPLEASLLRLFQRWGENDATPGDDASPGALVFPASVTRLHDAFLARKRLEGRGDFTDLMRRATRHLQDGGAASRQWRYVQVLVDEAQDLNRGQIEFLRALCQTAQGLTLVGDDDQSLYGFRGAIPNLLECSKAWFPDLAAQGLERIELRDNRRCGTGVVQAALRLVNLNRRDRPKALAALREGPAPGAMRFRDEREEAAFVAWRVETLLEEGVAPEAIAILARTSSALRGFETELVARRIPVARRDGSGLLESAAIRDVLAWLTLATTPDAAGAFLRVHARPPSGIGRATAARVVRLSEETGLTLREAMLSLGAGAATAEREALFGFVDRLDEMEEIISRTSAVREVLDRVLRSSGYGEWLASTREAAHQEDVGLLLSIADTASDLDEFLVTTCVSQTDDWVGANGRVPLTTLHGAKGLEWDHVFLVGAHGRAMPHAMSIQEFDIARSNWPGALLRSDPLLTIGRGGLEEERRLFHVGLTRARKTVTVTCPDVVRLLGKAHSVTPTPFLTEAGIPLSEPPRGWSLATAARRRNTPKPVKTWCATPSDTASETKPSPQMSLF